MEWGKILTRLSIMFVIVNIGLAVGNYNNTIKAYYLTDRRIENIKTCLSERDVMIETTLPKKFSPTHSALISPFQMVPQIRERIVKNVLGDEDVQVTKESTTMSYENPKRIYSKKGDELIFEKNSIIYKSNNIVPKHTIIAENKVKKIANSFFKKLDFGNNLTKPSIEYIPTYFGGIITYYDEYYGIPMFDSYVRIKVTENGVFETQVSKLTISNKPTPRKEIFPVDKVLFGIDKELERAGYTLIKPIKIQSITMGYKISNTEGMYILEEEAVPMYKLEIQGVEQPIFINAYTGLIEEEAIPGFYK